MQIIANAKGTRTIDITPEHVETIRKYQLFRNLIDSNGIIDETVLGKLRLNIRALLEHKGTSDKSLMDLCFDVIYNPDMKAIGLHNLIKLYAEHDADRLPADDQEGA